MATVLDLVKHYQHAIEKYPNDEHKILKCIDKLFNLDVTVQHLQETGVGRTINALRKEPGDVGHASRALVYKWKLMVAAEESDQDGDHNNDTSGYNGHENGRDEDNVKHHSRSRNDHHEKSSPIIKTEPKELNGNCSGSKRKNHSSEDDEPYSKKSKSSGYRSQDDQKRKPIEHIKREPSESNDESEDSDHSHDNNSDSEMSESSDEEKYSKKIIKQESSERHRPSSSSKNSSHKSSRDSKRDSSSPKKSHSSEKQSRSHYHSESSEKHSSDKYTSKDKPDDSSHKHKSSKEKDKSERSSKSDKHSSDKDKKQKEESKSSSSSRHKSESDKHKSSKTDNNVEKQHHSDKTSSKSEKHKSSSHSQRPDKEKHKSSSEKESSDDKHKSKHSSSSSSKEKHSSSSKEKSKDRSSSSSKEKTDSSSKDHNNYKSEKKHSSSESKSKHGDSKHKADKHVEGSSETKSKHKSSSSSSHKSKSSSSKSKDEVPKKTNQTSSGVDSDDGIDCGSGASFAEALGMISPAKPKKKTAPTNQPPNNNDLSPASLLAPSAKLAPLAPLPAIEISALPEISPNYKPRPPPKLLPHFTDEDAMNMTMSSKNQRTKVYSGNKVIGKIPTLYEMCVQVLQEHIDALEYTGGVPYDILKPVVDRATPQQLFMLEHYNPYLMDDTDHLWQKFCERNFRNKQRQELETWREMYMRCQEEQEHRLKSLTANIRIAQEAKKAPIKQTKMAYVDSVVKPPRNIARKQAQHGTAHAATASPAARVASLAAAPNVLRGNTRPTPSALGTSSFKPKKAPLMQKALQFMRGRKR